MSDNRDITEKLLDPRYDVRREAFDEIYRLRWRLQSLLDQAVLVRNSATYVKDNHYYAVTKTMWIGFCTAIKAAQKNKKR
jgi:hypothetical protein